MLLTTSSVEVASPPCPPRSRRRLLWRCTLLALVLFLGYEVSRRLFGANLHTVVPGRVYRGAQPSPELVKTLARDYGVRTIINLRGCGLPVPWYDRETEAVQHLGLDLEDVCFSALRLPSSLELRRLLEVLDRVQYPVYLHCRRGADRTGMAAAIIKLLDPAVSLAEGRKQLGLWYGHVALGKTRVLDRFFDLYEDWLTAAGRMHDPATLRHWLVDEYKGGWCSACFEEFTPLQVEGRAGEPSGFRVCVRNTSKSPWHVRTSAASGFHLAYQVWDGERMLAEGRGALFDKEIDPGEVLQTTLVVKPLAETGRFRLLVDMVEEQHCWFYQTGSEPTEEELVIRE